MELICQTLVVLVLIGPLFLHAALFSRHKPRGVAQHMSEIPPTRRTGNASGAVRIAGSINFKPKYAPNFRRVQLVHITPGLITNRAALESLGVVATPEPAIAVPPEPPVQAKAGRPMRPDGKPWAWPRYD